MSRGLSIDQGQRKEEGSNNQKIWLLITIFTCELYAKGFGPSSGSHALTRWPWISWSAVAISAGSQSHFEEALRECFLPAKETGCRTINKEKSSWCLRVSLIAADSTLRESGAISSAVSGDDMATFWPTENILHVERFLPKKGNKYGRYQIKSLFSSGQMNGSAGRRVNVMGTACPAQLRGNLIALHLLSSRRPPLWADKTKPTGHLLTFLALDDNKS